MRFAGIITSLIGLALAMAAPALAQTPAALPARPAPDTRIPWFVVDARGVLARIGTDAQTAKDLNVAELELSPKSYGVAAGAHVYPWRGKSTAFGVGGEALFAQSSFESVDPNTNKPSGDVFNRRLKAVSAQLSMNFGRKTGWSYLTVGYGPLAFESYPATATPDGLHEGTLNYGGGARWFNWDHLAFTFDIRFYATNPADATTSTAGRVRNRLFIMSGGIAIK